jgi:ubiquinone biosynthesis protein UbiJ
MAEITLEFIARQLDRLTNDVAQRRDDLLVLTAMVTRIDNTLRALLDEVRAMHTQFARLNERVRKLEDSDHA